MDIVNIHGVSAATQFKMISVICHVSDKHGMFTRDI